MMVNHCRRLLKWRQRFKSPSNRVLIAYPRSEDSVYSKSASYVFSQRNEYRSDICASSEATANEGADFHIFIYPFQKGDLSVERQSNLS